MDPKSPLFRDEAVVSGNVVDWKARPVEAARVDLGPGSYYGLSGASGQYEIQAVRTGSYVAVCSKDGFSEQSLATEVAAGAPTVLNFTIDHLPILSGVIATTHNDSVVSGNDMYVRFFARTYDPDGSVWGDSVFVLIDTSFSWSMTHMGGDTCDSFSLVVPDDSLPGGTLEYLIGKNMEVRATDDAGERSVSDPFTVSRIMYESPIAASPSGTAPQNPVTFKWFTVRGSFEFTYTLTVQETWPNEKSWVIEGIPRTSNEYLLAEILESGIYRWSIKAVDTFGNSSRSQVVAFMVN